MLIQVNLVARSGATFQIKDEVGNLVSLLIEGEAEKTSTFTADEGGQITFGEKIPAGKYTLVEIAPPKGYKLADPIDFEVTGEKTVVSLEVRDKRVTTSVNIKKLDASTGQKCRCWFRFQYYC